MSDNQPSSTENAEREEEDKNGETGVLGLVGEPEGVGGPVYFVSRCTSTRLSGLPGGGRVSMQGLV